jgi:hypothetical protein
MDVKLPETGCNILTSSTSFYNYSPDGRTRERYYIYDGEAHMESSTYSQYGYTYTGTCLSTGDLVYRPEMQIYFPFLALGLIVLAYLFFYKIILKRLLP